MTRSDSSLRTLATDSKSADVERERQVRQPIVSTIFLWAAVFASSFCLASQHQTEELSVVFLSMILDGKVVVIDAQTDTIIRFLSTGSTPAEVGVVEALGRAFVADLTAGTVTVLSVSDYSIITAIDVGSPVATVGVDEAAQKVYALDFSNGEPGTDLHVIDAGTNLEIGPFSIGSQTQNIAVSAADDLAYVTDFVAGVVVVDADTGLVVDTLPMTGLPHGIALDQAANRLYVTRLENDVVSIIDTTSLTEIGVLTVGDLPQWIALDLTRNKAFVTNEGDGTVSVIDTSTGTLHGAPIPVGVEPLTLVIHEGEAKAYVYNVGDGSISVIDTITETVIATIRVVFGDGFESGNTSAWSAASRDQPSLHAQSLHRIDPRRQPGRYQIGQERNREEEQRNRR